MSSRDRERFFVQPMPREPWHLETLDDCELMECGLRISVQEARAQIRKSWGVRKCIDCWVKWQALSPSPS